MSAKIQEVLTIGYVTDHDCGNYHIGEIDFGVRQGILREYLEQYGLAGKKGLIQTLSTLMFIVESEFRNLPDGSECKSAGDYFSMYKSKDNDDLIMPKSRKDIEGK